MSRKKTMTALATLGGGCGALIATGNAGGIR